MKIYSPLALVITATVFTVALGANAQTIYRIVGADGKVTFSDKPPTSDQGKVAATGVGASGSASGNSLPGELRQVAAKYPVTLYTGTDCAPCGQGRSMLMARGIPFSERTVSTPDDVASLQRIAGDASLPFLTIGGQHLRGFSDSEWNQYLDAAGYPATSKLPASYKNVPASPLVAVQASPPPKPKADANPNPDSAAAPTQPTQPANNPSNPTGIQF